ncbi:Annexin [Aureobasidium subglaciale]|nr:Annexin [Aureobasidium subglaciale]
MSLRPEDHRSSRSRSKSHSRRDRSRSHSNIRNTHNVTPERPAEYVYANTPASVPRHISPVVTMPAMPGDYEDEYTVNPGSSRSDGQHLPYPVVGQLPYPSVPQEIDMGDYKDLPPHERPGYAASRDAYDSDFNLAYGTLPVPEATRGRGSSMSSQRAPSPSGYTSASYRYPSSGALGPQYATSKTSSGQAQQYHYSQTPTEQPSSNYDYSAQPYGAKAGKQSQTSSHRAQTADVKPGISKQTDLGLNVCMDRLSVSGNRPDLSGIPPPPSPLLEAYRGTYQSVSPMMAPMNLSPDSDLDRLSSLSPSPASGGKHHRRSRSSTGKVDFVGSGSESNLKELKKRARLYDAEKDVLALNEAISHHRIDVETICRILPSLNHDQILELRKEYKKHVKVQGRGINIAKHMKMKLSGNFGKAVYICALGRYESEGYWANFWYQSHSSRRELLIESLMGRSNAEIRQIRESFKDKRYNDDLVRCMEKELKPDKFRVAVLTALEARRQEENEVYPKGYIDKDVEVLNRCLTAKEGGESTMLDIVVRRSDAHLREVLKAYERRHGVNFAREALRKSNNLVGEVICHILNGAINRPARDALLLRHAIDDIGSHNRDEELRYELLVSRLTRVHWDHAHLARVKREYGEKYRKELEHDVEDATKGDFRDFMYEICKA